jgi:hypothetical protein
MLGINPTDLDDNAYVIRRAITIRSMILQFLGDRKQELQLNVDKSLLRALLQVPRYRHGGRSLRLLLESLRPTSVNVTKLTLPSLSQLNMLVDGKAFLDLMEK